MFGRTKSQAACSLALLFISQAALAGSIGVSPIRIHLTAQQPTTMLTVQNWSEDETTILQLQLNSWSQEDGEDVLEQTRDLIVVPPLISLQPGSSQVVRIGLRGSPPIGKEASYRLLLREVPKQPTPDFHGLQVALNLSLPVFVRPAREVRAEMQYRLVDSGSDGLELHVSNVGDAHIQFQGLNLADRAGTELSGHNLPVYLLPGQHRMWKFETNVVAQQWTVSAQTNAGEVEAELLLETD